MGDDTKSRGRLLKEIEEPEVRIAGLGHSNQVALGRSRTVKGRPRKARERRVLLTR